MLFMNDGCYSFTYVQTEANDFDNTKSICKNPLLLTNYFATIYINFTFHDSQCQLTDG